MASRHSSSAQLSARTLLHVIMNHSRDLSDHVADTTQWSSVALH